MELQTSFSYYPKESLFLASSLERRVKNCPFMGRQLPKKSSEKAIWGWAGLAGAQTPETKCAAEAAAELPWQVLLGLWDSKMKQNEEGWKKKGRGTVGEEIFFTLNAGKIKPLCTSAGFWRMFCFGPWLSPSQFKSLVWYMVMPITPSPCFPPHIFLFLCFSPN